MKYAVLSFDVEEFDLPREHGEEIPLEEGVRVSSEGLEKILEIMKKSEVKATFFDRKFCRKKSGVSSENSSGGA